MMIRNRVLPVDAKTFLKIALIILFLPVITTCGHDSGNLPAGEVGDNSQTLYGTPYKISIAQVPKNETNIKFGLISDTHVDTTTTSTKPLYSDSTYGYNDSDYMKHNRGTVDDINVDCKKPPACLGVVHMGDMVEQNPDGGGDPYSTQQVIAFRQMYEVDYPGQHGGYFRDCSPHDSHECLTAYMRGEDGNTHWIRFPVFPTLGNHDAPSSWHKPADYLSERIKGAVGIVGQYGKASYIWRWGQYYFIQLGLWAGSYEHESNKDIDHDKLGWLKDWLRSHVGDSNMGVLIFQHYPFGTGDRWWSSSMEDLERNILCRRDNNAEVCNPYNVVGIFAGHEHLRAFRPVAAGKDKQLRDVSFDQYLMPDVGKNNNKQYGHAIVALYDNLMTIDTKNRDNGQWSHYEKPISTGPGDPNSFRYAIGWDLQSDGSPGGNAWSPVINFLDQPFGGGVPSGGGAAIANIDPDPRPDLVLMGIDSAKGNRFYYKVGRNLNPDGKTSDWSHAKWAPPILGAYSAGGGAAIADINRNGTPDLLFMVVDNPEGMNNFRYVIGWDLNANGDPATWSPLKYAPTSLQIGTESAGGGAAIANISGIHGQLDLLLMVVDNPEGMNNFRYVIGWNLDADGNPSQWSELKYAPTSLAIGFDSAGGGAAIANIDGNRIPDLLFMVVDNPPGRNNFRYVVGWNLDADGNPSEWSELKYAPTSLDIGDETSGGGAAMAADLNGNGKLDLLLMAIDNP